MQLQTKYVIRTRKQEVRRLNSISDSELTGDEIDVSKFRSANIAGMFVNPFDEYRPQTAFEFVLVRVMEFFESIYGSRFELHDRVPGNEDVDVEHLLKLFNPDLEQMRKNSAIFQECVKLNDFKRFSLASSSWFSGSASLSQQILFTWLGQSCSLVQVSGVNFLTDPLFSDHLINKRVGPKRLIKSAMTLEDVKYATNDKLDFVLVSHDHPDHLEMDVVKKIGNSATWVVPLGLKKKLARKGVYKVIELDWWDTVNINPYIGNDLPDTYEIVCVPAMHWSGRYVFDSNKSLWCSFIIRRNGESLVYHAGDTGYSKDLFNIIGRKYGPIKLGLLPIGQYCPSWHQKPRHISPEEALQVCLDLSIKFMKGVHWGTFKLSSEPILEPKTLLTKLSANIGKSDFYKVPEFGLTYRYDLERETEVELII